MEKITTPQWDLGTWLSATDYINYCVQFVSNALDITSSSRLLDIGCGRGHLTKMIANYNQLSTPIEAIDVSDTVHEAKPTDNAVFYQRDALEYLSGKNQRYDGVLMKQMFHLIPSEKRRPLCLQIKNSLKQGGKGLVLMMSADSEIPIFDKARAIMDAERLYLDEVVLLAQASGFSTQVAEFKYEVSIKKSEYLKLIARRYMSPLRITHFSDEEIQIGIRELDQQLQSDQLTFMDKMDAVFFIND